MAKIAKQEFIDLIIRSKLMDEKGLTTALEELSENLEGSLPETAAKVGELLVSNDLITRWQCDKLLEGRHKGFFLGKYKLLRLLGAGGMSTVYLAEHVLMQRKVAIKVLPRKRVNDSSYLERFRLEGQAAAALDDPNVVRAFDIDQQNDHHFLVMEYVEGADLQSIVKDKGPLDVDVAANFTAQAASGLQHAHDVGLVHRDIKPANLLVDLKNVVKVLDLGLAMFSDPEASSLTEKHDENVLGTADYLAPEQAVNSHKIDHRADIYSLGCTLYFMLTAHAPFPTGTQAERLLAHQTKIPAGITKERPDVPKSLVEICRRMMAKKRTRRFQTAQEVHDTLNQWLITRGQKPVSNAQKKLATVGAEGSTTSSRKPPVNFQDDDASVVTFPAEKPQSIQDTIADLGQSSTIKGPSGKSGKKSSLPVARSLDADDKIGSSQVFSDLNLNTASTDSAKISLGPTEPKTLLERRHSIRGKRKEIISPISIIFGTIALGILAAVVIFLTLTL